MSDHDAEKQDPSTLGRRGFVGAASTAAAVSLVPSSAGAAKSRAARRRVVSQVRKQLQAKTKLKVAQVNSVVRQVKELLPRLGELSYGHVVIGINIGADGQPHGLSGCEDGHSCAGTFDEVPPDPSCSEQGTICDAEACDTQSCDDHWCVENTCDTESCDNNICENQACDTEACKDQNCTTNVDTVVVGAMSKSPGWAKVQADLTKLKKAKQLKVTLTVQ